jgi:hypothetical protein
MTGYIFKNNKEEKEMNRAMFINAANEIVKNHRDDLLKKDEARCMIEGIKTLVNHSNMSSEERYNIKDEIQVIWNKENYRRRGNQNIPYEVNPYGY